MSLKIEAGKFYRTRDGKKVRVYATDGMTTYSTHGAILRDEGWSLAIWTSRGEFYANEESIYDLISEWIDLPKVDWDAMPKWATCVTMNPNGKWKWHHKKPHEGVLGWIIEGTCAGGIPEEYAPKWSGDWKQSLVQRPESK